MAHRRVHPDRVKKLAVLSVGHPGTPRTLRQDEMAWYQLFFQFEGIAEATLQYQDWAWLRRFSRGDGTRTLPRRPVPARRAHRVAELVPGQPGAPDARDCAGTSPVRVPTLGIWSTDDHYLDGERMEKSGAYVEAPWRYEVIEGASHWIRWTHRTGSTRSSSSGCTDRPRPGD
jgi:pimeloyl-ACP methyl ester carboxylesterase